MTASSASLEPVTRDHDVDAREVERARREGEQAQTTASQALASFEGWGDEDGQDGPAPLDATSQAWARSAALDSALGPYSKFKSLGSFGSSGYYGGLVTLQLAGAAAMRDPFAQHPMVYAAVGKKADTLGALPMRLERQVLVDGRPKWLPLSEYGDAAPSRAGSTQSAKASSSLRATRRELDLVRLLSSPNPLDSAMDFRTRLAQHLELDGESLILLMGESVETGKPNPPVTKSEMMGVELDEVPRYLWAIRGEYVQPLTEHEHATSPRRFSVQSMSETWPAGAAVWCRRVSPSSTVRGLGPLSPIRRKLEQDFTVDRFSDALLKNGGQPSGFLQVKESVDRSIKTRMSQSWSEQYGGSQNAGKVAILDGGAEFKSAALGPKDMQFSELTAQNRIDEMMVLGATKPVLGITDDVNRANAHEAMRVWYEVSIKPLAAKIADQLNHGLISRIKGLGAGASPAALGHRITFDFSAVPFLQDDEDKLLERAIKIAEAFHVSPADAMRLAKMQVEDVQAEGLDERWMPKDRVPHAVASDPGFYEPGEGKGSGTDGSKSLLPQELQTKAADEPDDDEEPEGPTPEEEAREAERKAFARWKSHDEFLESRERPTKRAIQPVLEGYVLAARSALRKIAKGERSLESPARARLERSKAKRGRTPSPVHKYVASQPEIERALALNQVEWALAMKDAAFPELEKTLVAAAEALNLEVSGGSTILDVSDPQVVSFLAEKEVVLAEGATSTLATDVQAKIVKVLAGAEDATTLADAVREVLEDLEAEMKVMKGQMGARAEMIARTETASATSFARTEQMGIDGIERHTWLSSRDGAVRDSHADLEGKTVRVGEVFGYGLAHPGDGQHGAAAGDIVNCRCTTLPEID